jgi:mRNA-degrading endonuclease YafQ of YafQ-DinJ toxin-antitoxin module
MYHKSLIKLTKNNVQLANDVYLAIAKLCADPKDPSLSSHVVGNKLSSSVNYSVRILWEYGDSNSIILLNIGSHDQVYNS